MMQEFPVIVHHHRTVEPDPEKSQVPFNELADHLASHGETQPAVPPAHGRIPSGRRPAGNTNGAFLAISNILRIAGFATYGQVILGIGGQERGWNQVGTRLVLR